MVCSSRANLKTGSKTHRCPIDNMVCRYTHSDTICVFGTVLIASPQTSCNKASVINTLQRLHPWPVLEKYNYRAITSAQDQQDSTFEDLSFLLNDKEGMFFLLSKIQRSYHIQSTTILAHTSHHLSTCSGKRYRIHNPALPIFHAFTLTLCHMDRQRRTSPRAAECVADVKAESVHLPTTVRSSPCFIYRRYIDVEMLHNIEYKEDVHVSQLRWPFTDSARLPKI